MEIPTTSDPRRQFRRFPLAFSTEYRWKTTPGQQKAKGVTRDISLVGVYIASSVCPPPGCYVELEISTKLPGAKELTMLIKTEGHVVRVQKTNLEEGGFAVRLEKKLKLTYVTAA